MSKEQNIEKEKNFPKNPDDISGQELKEHFDLNNDGKVNIEEYAEHINYHCENPETLQDELEQAEYQRGFKYKKGGKTKEAKTWKEKYNKKYGNDLDESNSLAEIAKDTGVSKKGLQKIYNKGVGAYKTNPGSVRPNVKSKEQWAQARVYSAVMGGKASKVDAKELKMEKGGEVEEYVVIKGNKTKTFDNKKSAKEYKKKNGGEYAEIIDGRLKVYKDQYIYEEGGETEDKRREIIDKHRYAKSVGDSEMADEALEEYRMFCAVKGFKKGGLAPEKAKKILEDGMAQGKKLTDKQKRYFGYIAGGGKGKYAKGGRVRYMLNGWEANLNYILDSTNGVEVAREGSKEDGDLVIYFETKDEEYAKGGKTNTIKIKTGRYRDAKDIAESNNLFDYAERKGASLDYSSGWEDEIDTLLEGTNYESEKVMDYYTHRGKKGEVNWNDTYVILKKKSYAEGGEIEIGGIKYIIDSHEIAEKFMDIKYGGHDWFKKDKDGIFSDYKDELAEGRYLGAVQMVELISGKGKDIELISNLNTNDRDLIKEIISGKRGYDEDYAKGGKLKELIDPTTGKVMYAKSSEVKIDNQPINYALHSAKLKGQKEKKEEDIKMLEMELEKIENEIQLAILRKEKDWKKMERTKLAIRRLITRKSKELHKIITDLK